MSCQTYVIMQDGALATGDGAALPCTSNEYTLTKAALQLTIAGTATVTFEATVDGTNWGGVSAHDVTQVAGQTHVATATASGIYHVDVAGFDSIRARISSWTSGAVTVVGRAIEE